MRKQSFALALAMALVMSSVCPSAQAALTPSGPFNRIVVVVDASDSFKQRRLEAIERAQRLVQQLSARKLKRWEAADQVVIISLDAMPEVLWEGDTRALTQSSRGDWISRFKARSDYARCTDVQAALELALSALERAPQPAAKYLIGFSDLIHEPPLQSPSKCKAPTLPSVPGKDFAWDRLADVSVAMFWLPPAQKLAWDRTMKDSGLTTFKLLTNSESSAVEIDLPRPPVHEVTEQEREQVTEKLSGWAWIAAKAVAALIAMAGVCGGAYLAVIRLRQRGNRGAQRSTPTATAQAARRVTGVVAPMKLPPPN